MSEMVERAARAIKADDGSPCIAPSSRLCRHADGCICRSLANAVIKTLREPTDPMMQAFVDLALHGDVLSHGGWKGYARDQWQTMIDAGTK